MSISFDLLGRAGNNNYYTLITSLNKTDHPPSGRDFPTYKPTGWFSNGKLVPDFFAHTLNLKDVVPPFLDPGLADIALLTGVSFASGGSGFDDLTTVLPMSKQADYFRMYKERVSKIIRETKAKNLIKKALLAIFNGANDFTLNDYDLPTIRRLQYNITGYQDFVLEKLQDFLEVYLSLHELHGLGCQRMVVAGLPLEGCLPIQITSRANIPNTCLDGQNSEAMSYNNKLLRLILRMQRSLQGSHILYADIYTPIIKLLDNSQDYDLTYACLRVNLWNLLVMLIEQIAIEVTDKGCCRTGYIEAAGFCNVLTPKCRRASDVDTGNNNNYTPITSLNRADHPPYGRDFPTHKPIGRFSNGKLVPDFFAHTLDLKDVVPPYLDLGLADIDLLTGVSFGSAGSGFDDLTTVPTGAIPIWNHGILSLFNNLT
ncbi:hypothetical protein Cgig2_004003 [Carnegiea gigantea]|uniref:GDSL esterase/lipase n=1 Tax=Carnegiea gigantea TaxID=171969 RepID=A0A9Q1KBQ2_9CARY|nr:hypothetical protein Cgig2_004003 [Carnegiea gigantea]